MCFPLSGWRFWAENSPSSKTSRIAKLMLLSQLWKVLGSRFPPHCRCPQHRSGNHRPGGEWLGGIRDTLAQARGSLPSTKKLPNNHFTFSCFKKRFKALVFLKTFITHVGNLGVGANQETPLTYRNSMDTALMEGNLVTCKGDLFNRLYQRYRTIHFENLFFVKWIDPQPPQKSWTNMCFFWPQKIWEPRRNI